MKAPPPDFLTPGKATEAPLPPQEILQDKQVGLAQAPMELLLLSQNLVYVRLCVRLLQERSLRFFQSFAAPASPAGLQCQRFWGLFLPMPDF